MQGQRGTIGSLPEMLDFDHGNTSNDAAIDQQICWNGTRNPSESRIPDYIESPTDMNVGFRNSVGRERRNLGRWCLGEPSSRNSQGEAGRDERKPDFGWSSSVDACGEAGLRLEERSYEPTNNLSLDNNMNSIFTQSSNSDAIPQNLNLNAGFSGHGGDSSQAMECPSIYKYNVTETERTRPTGSSDPFLLPAASMGFLVGENDGRPGCSLEGRRVSCKRKTMEGHLGQSSLSGNCSYFPHTESGARPSAPAHYNAGINISSPSQERNPRLGPGGRELTADSLPDSNVGRGSESSHRNFRVRLNPSNQQSSIASTRFSSGRAARHSSGSSSQLSPGLLPVDHSLDLRTTPVLDNMSSQNPPGLVHVPAIPQNVQSLRWNGGSSSRTGSLSNSVFMGDRDAPVHEEVSSRSMARQILGHPIFVPATELRNSARLSAGSSSRNPTGANVSVPGNVASTSRTGPSSSTHPASAPTWPHHNSHPQFPRRLSEYVRRSLFSAGGNESGNQGSNFLPMRSGNASSQEAVHSSGVANTSHHQPHPRSAASWLERHGDGLGLPYSLRTLAAAGEGSNRLVSEQICNVLGLMRRGESLRFEDVMILDQSMLFGVADIHDRHRERMSQKVFDYRLLRRTVKSPIFTTLAFVAIFFFVYEDTIVSNLPMPPAFLTSTHEHHLDDHHTTETVSITKLTIQEKIDEFTNDEFLDPLIPPDNVTKEERLVWFRRKLPELEILQSNDFTQKFHGRVLEFLNNGCSTQFYMIWLSPAKSFGKREFLAMDTLFNSHPKGCLIIISRSMDSELGYRILKPLLDRDFKILAITPDLPFLVKNTPAESWLDEMKSGRRDPGNIPLSQNLSNLIRLAMLYKYGGVYLDTDFIILKDFSGLRNAVGAQSIDSKSKNWTRLNGAVMIFDIHHPLLRDFLDEFASTYNGNKWGYNGPYLVSRVIEKVGSTPGYNLTILPLEAFYPVDWNRIGRLYTKPKTDLESRWEERMLNELHGGETYAIHLWNKRSRILAIEEGSVMARLISEHCVICQDIYAS